MEMVMDVKKSTDKINVTDRDSVTKAIDTIVLSAMYCLKSPSLLQEVLKDDSKIDALLSRQYVLVDKLLEVMELLGCAHLCMEDGDYEKAKECMVEFEINNKKLMEDLIAHVELVLTMSETGKCV
jgi:hypothetical protein